MRNFLIRILTGFIPSKNARKRFRAKYMKVDPIWKVRDELKSYINKRIVDVANTMIDINAIPPAKGNLRKIQIAESKLLSVLCQILDKNNLNYWLDYGTLIGAYRNQGFVPWDDDIDIGMMRDDYDKLKEILSDNDKYVLEDILLPWKGKVYRFCLKNELLNSMFYVDIFTYDYVDCEDKEEYYKKYIENKNNRNKELEKLKIKHSGVCKNEKEIEQLETVYNKYIKIYAGGGIIQNTFCSV